MKLPRLLLLLLGLGICSPSRATNGYFMFAFGTKASGMGGATTALAQDSMIGATNPAGMVRVGNRLDIGAALFIPIRSYCYTGSEVIPPDNVKSDNTVFGVPHFGLNYLIREKNSFGLSVYAQGINTNYPRNNPVFGQKRLGANVIQIFVAPTYSRMLPCRQSIGISPVFVLQFFQVKGLQNFDNAIFSEHPGKVTNKRHDVVAGIGARFGWLGTFWDKLQLGVSYTTPSAVGTLKSYKGLVTQQGKFNIPDFFSSGIAIKNLWDVFTIAFDYQRIFYGRISFLANGIQQLGLPVNPADIKNKLGSDNGPGLGWESINVYKIGAQYNINCRWIVRTGFSHGDIPFDCSQMDLNILPAAVIRNHYTVGFSIEIKQNHGLDFAYIYSQKNKLSGLSVFGLGCITGKMLQHTFELNYFYTF